jgi:phosphatidylinositol alpha-1,6-mannosyltransferase
VRDEGHDVEGFGIVFLEAAMARTPSIAGRSGGASEAVIHESTGLLVKPTDVDSVEDAVMRLLYDEGLRTKLADQGKKRAEIEFRWEDRWKTLKNLLGN